MTLYEVQHLDLEGGVQDSYQVRCTDIAQAHRIAREPDGECAVFILSVRMLEEDVPTQ